MPLRDLRLLVRFVQTILQDERLSQVASLHRTLVVLAVGLLALAAPLVAYAGNGGPGTG